MPGSYRFFRTDSGPKTWPQRGQPPSTHHTGMETNTSSRPPLSAQNDNLGAEQEEYEDVEETRRLLLQSDHHAHTTSAGGDGGGGAADSFFFEHVAERIQERDRKLLHAHIIKGITFFWAILSCLCAGSITAYSLYAPLFQSHLKYNEYQVNIVSITAEIGLYGVVPLFGFLCDRYGPGICAFLSAIFFSCGYFLAAFTYHSGAPAPYGHGWPFAIMVVAFFAIGMGTSSLYLSAVTTCAKNFARSKYKGFALAAPIASFGLSGMWQSQVGARFLYEKDDDGVKTGDVDVFKYFLFLAGLLLGVGLVGTFALRIVDEKLIIDDAMEELERSGLLENSAFFQRGSTRSGQNYGTMGDRDSLASSEDDYDGDVHDRASSRKWLDSEHDAKRAWLLNAETRRFLADPTLWFLAAGFFLVTGPGEAFINNLGTVIGTLYSDPAASRPGGAVSSQPKTSPATHVSIVAFSSTVARLLAGTLSDMFGPTPVPLSQQKHHHHQHHRRGPSGESLTSTLSSLDPLPSAAQDHRAHDAGRFTIPRPVLLLAAAIVSSVGLALLASGYIQEHASQRFWAVSALIGTGYGAVFSLVPLIVSCVWGVHNFATNWSIVAMVPALGATLWGAVYAGVYEMEESRQHPVAAAAAAFLAGGSSSGSSIHGGRLPLASTRGFAFGGVGLASLDLSGGGGGSSFFTSGSSSNSSSGGGGQAVGAGHCYGVNCYRSTFWAMTVCVWIACVLWVWAWKGPHGWTRRGVRV